MLKKLGKYEIKRELGRGAMGIVYEGFDPFIQRTVAIKTVQKSLLDQSEAQDALNRFRREAQASGRLTHPSIVSIYEYGEEGDVAFIAMEFITGRELKDYFDKSERFSIKDGVQIMLQLLDALEYSHERGVVHRDIKPSNIIITQNNQIKVVDFGIARIESSDLTQVGMVLGTPAYMSPEQFKGLVADRRSDIYSTGVILYQFLTGARPFIGNPTTLMHKVLSQDPVPPTELNPEVSERLAEVVKKAMSKEPADRFQTASEFKRALSRATGVAAKPAGEDTTVVMPKDKPANPDATLVLPKAGGQQKDAAEINFDLMALSTNIEKKLQEASLDSGSKTSKAEPEIDPALMTYPQFQKEQKEEDSGSALLAGLASEAQQKQQAGSTGIAGSAGSQTDNNLEKTLNRIYGFLNSFASQVKKAQPLIKRNYSFGRSGIYSGLTCQDARAESRRKSLSETALLDFVYLSMLLTAPGPVAVTRPRDMLEMLKGQLSKIKLKALDDLDRLAEGPQEEWVKLHLAPDFPVQIQFKANYDKNSIDVQALNVEAFGIVRFTLDIKDVTQELMDGIGYFLLGRADKLPEALKRVEAKKKS